METYQIAVIGSGPAGEKAAIEAARLGAKVAIIEQGQEPGGAGVISGTMPSKSLRETVLYLDRLNNDRISGIERELGHKMTLRELMYRKDMVTALRVHKIRAQYKEAGVELILGKARLYGPHQIEIEQSNKPAIQIKADKIIIAVGTGPYHPPDVDFTKSKILDSDKILDLPETPKSLIVYGGGVIGSEYASIFAKMSVPVTLVEPRGNLLDFLDPDLSSYLAQSLMANKVELHLGESYKTITADQNQVVVRLNSGDQLTAQYLLYANGRQGHSADLGLEKLGVELNHRLQIPVNNNYQTSLPHLYACGDIIGPPSLVSISNEEGRMAARHAVLGEPGRRITEAIPCAVYTLPELAMMGPTETDLIKAGVDYLAGACLFTELARGLILGVEEGLLKLLFERETKKLLSVHIMGQGASELIHLGQAVIAFGGTIDYFVNSVLNFPSLTSAYKVAALNGLARQSAV